MKIVLTLLHPFYDFRNRALCDLYEDWDYQKLIKQYGKKYSEVLEEAIMELSKKDSSKNTESVVKYIKEYIRSNEGRDGFKTIFAEVVQECLSKSDEKYIAQVWTDVVNKLYNKTVIYRLEYNQIKCVEEIGVLREVQGGVMVRNPLPSVKECANYIEDNLGFKREHAEFTAECVIEAFTNDFNDN